MADITDYFLRITPGLVLIVALFLLLPRKQIITRVFLLILGFILMRDAMTPAGFWAFGVNESSVWIRFTNDGWMLVVLAVLSLATSFMLLRVTSLAELVRWGNTSRPLTYLVGIAAGFAVSLPFLLLSLPVDSARRGGEVAMVLLPALLLMSLAGNFLEELIFRGFLQGYFEKHMSTMRAALISGGMFAAAHIYLASTVTDLGWPLLVFVLVEGLACALIYRKFGLISAALTHGTAIFILASGLF